MELKTVTSTMCGGSIKASADKRTAVCEFCGSSFAVEIAEKLSRIEVDRTKDLKNLRLRLSEAVKANDIRNISIVKKLVFPRKFRGDYRMCW